jgi:hypothetical protein
LGGKERGEWTAVITVLAIAAAIEFRRVFVLKTWGYTPRMFTLFGIGLSPLLQLSVSGVLAFWITKRIIYQRNSGMKI